MLNNQVNLNSLEVAKLGRPLETRKPRGKQGQKVLDTRKFPKGTYLFTIKTAGFVKTGIFMISK